ncbi:hypothetical protein ACGFYV_07565 [Streptomyces sp. NPDC048297]|uniref:hypothetical protein n=1 Tax=Streptomyces sp. NPDC048297 TaxID=3365531 RepID=UPI003711DE90
MTIEVYRINPETGARTQVRGKHTVEPSEAPDFSSRYPMCECPRCTAPGSRSRMHALVTEANRRSRGEV